ncbi:MAG: type II CAAX prenyl endopeptidase Rce1 family protein [Caulobacteraceae bacterium]
MKNFAVAVKGIIKRAENNIYRDISFLGVALVIGWTVACLILTGTSKSFGYSFVFGAIYYISLILLCLAVFKNIGKYFGSPFKLNSIPKFIGSRLDIVFTYPVFLVSFIGVVSSMLTLSGLVPRSPEPLTGINITTDEVFVRFFLLPFVAFAEELLNLIVVSFLYKCLKVLRSSRLLASVLTASAVFGFLHSFGWGFGAALSVAVSFLPVFFVTLYTGNIWISVLAHLYNDIIASIRAYNGSYATAMIAVIVFVPVVWSIAAAFGVYGKNK